MYFLCMYCLHQSLGTLSLYLGRCLLIDADDLLRELEGQHEAAWILLPIYACYDSLQDITVALRHQLHAMHLNRIQPCD